MIVKSKKISNKVFSMGASENSNSRVNPEIFRKINSQIAAIEK